MKQFVALSGRWMRGLWFVALGAFLAPSVARCQDDAGPPPLYDSTRVVAEKAVEKYTNLYQGQFTPGAGFDIIRTTRGTLNISVYGLFRWLDQTPANQTFTDHLGRERTPKMRN